MAPVRRAPHRMRTRDHYSDSIETWCVIYPRVTVFEPGKFRVTAGHRWSPLREFPRNLINHFPRLTITMAYCEPAQNFAGTVNKYGIDDQWEPKQYIFKCRDDDDDESEGPQPDPSRDWKHICAREGCPGYVKGADGNGSDGSDYEDDVAEDDAAAKRKGENEAEPVAEPAAAVGKKCKEGYLVCGRVRELFEVHGLPSLSMF